jgi:hypothetical protein
MIAKRYHQSEDSVIVTLDHSACMVMGGTFEGTYILTITSVAQISPTINKHNAALITDWFKKNLGVSGNRGVVRFLEAGFANYATCGETMLSLMEKEEDMRTGTTSGLICEMNMKRSVSRNQSKRRRREDTAMAEPSKGPLGVPTDNVGRLAPENGRMRKKSIFNLFSKSQRLT